MQSVAETPIFTRQTEKLFTEDEKRFSAPTSMRDVEPSVHVWRRFKLGSKQ